MAGLVPAIYAFFALGTKDVDARHKAGYDEDARYPISFELKS
jgi:hypothetical protein